MRKDASIITTLSLAGITMLSGIFLASSKVSADDSAVDTTTITVPVSCTMSGNIATGQEHSATLQPGTYSGASGSQYENGIGKTTLTTFCNDNNGFSIYAIGFTGDSYDGENHTKLVGTSASGNATIATKVYEPSDTTSNWSMKVTKVDDSTQSYNPANMSITNSFNNWHIVPDTYTKVAEYHAATGSSTTDTTLGAKVETTYATYISTTQPADTYTGKVKYTMVHPYNEEPLQPQPSTAGCINYFANASDAVGTMGCQSESSEDGYSYHTIADGGSATLLASNFSRTGYGFAGWSDKFDYATNPQAHFYGPMETITVPTGTTANGLSLYAVWIKTEGSIQDQSKVASVCSSLTTALTDGTANLTSVSALTDQRDNNTYAIAKLADGKCWMIENLRLESTAEHNTDGTLAQGYNSSFAGLADPEVASLFTDTTTANTLYSTDGSTDKTISGNNQGFRFPRYNNINTPTNAADRPQNPTSNKFENDSATVGMYSYGNYYTWAAAIADTAAYTSGNTSATNTSICPSGWRLPKGGLSANVTNSDFWQLGLGIMGTAPSNNNYYTSNETNSAGKTAIAAFRSYPNNFVYSGYVVDGSVRVRGSSGIFWSSTAYSSNFAYNLDLVSSGDVYPGSSFSLKYFGWTVRCVAHGV